MTPVPFAPSEEMERYLRSKKWRKVSGGWFSPNEKEFGKGIYSLTNAYRLQKEVDPQGG